MSVSVKEYINFLNQMGYKVTYDKNSQIYTVANKGKSYKFDEQHFIEFAIKKMNNTRTVTTNGVKTANQNQTQTLVKQPQTVVNAKSGFVPQITTLFVSFFIFLSVLIFFVSFKIRERKILTQKKKEITQEVLEKYADMILAYKELLKDEEKEEQE